MNYNWLAAQPCVEISFVSEGDTFGGAVGLFRTRFAHRLQFEAVKRWSLR